MNFCPVVSLYSSGVKPEWEIFPVLLAKSEQTWENIIK